MKFQGEYPPEWPEVSELVKKAAGYKCERCKSPSVPGKILTVHHLDGDKGNLELWNLAALCQACHLHIQGKVFLPQFFMFEHSGLSPT
jgi:5-methylcytosine-specific restriction endonuclease McrA